MTDRPFTEFTEAIAHELRTPLAAIAAEVDLALARDRSADAYRAALSRIAECVAEMIDLTGDFALYGGGSSGNGDDASHLTSIAAVFEALGTRYGARRGAPVTFAPGTPTGAVAGRGALVTGAVALLIEHALRHRRSGARVVLTAPSDAPGATSGTIDLLLDAEPGGFTASAWAMLPGSSTPAGALDQHLRVGTATAIIGGCGGSVELTTIDGAERVLIRLRAAAMRPDEADGTL